MEKVVVITGASSGLGREAAIQFAARGYAVVLAARRRDALEDTASLCRRAGGPALCVTCDVLMEEEVENLARSAVAAFGRIDVWVNNAGVTLFARLDEAPFAEHRRVIETNVLGAMLGARAVLPVFRRQQSGVLINVGSTLSKIGQPFVPSYVISKFALRGLSEALRTDIADCPDVHVCTLYPFTIDTQHFESGANRVGREARSIPPLQSPEKVARALVDLAERPRRELHVPRVTALGLALHALLPRTVERLVREALLEWHFGERPQAGTTGNLYRPIDAPARVHGDRPPLVRTPSFAAWATRRLVRLELRSARRTLGRLRRKPPGERDAAAARRTRRGVSWPA